MNFFLILLSPNLAQDFVDYLKHDLINLVQPFAKY